MANKKPNVICDPGYVPDPLAFPAGATAPAVEEPSSEFAADPRRICSREGVEMGDVVVGDFVQASGWSKPRLVVHVDEDASGPILHMAERHGGIRRVDTDAWDCRGRWARWVELSRLWRAANGG